jgi:hypothetical protein
MGVEAVDGLNCGLAAVGKGISNACFMQIIRLHLRKVKGED